MLLYSFKCEEDGFLSPLILLLVLRKPSTVKLLFFPPFREFNACLLKEWEVSENIPLLGGNRFFFRCNSGKLPSWQIDINKILNQTLRFGDTDSVWMEFFCNQFILAYLGLKGINGINTFLAKYFVVIPDLVFCSSFMWTLLVNCKKKKLYKRKIMFCWKIVI